VSEVPVEIATAGGSPVLLYVQTVDAGGEAEVGFSVVDGLRQVTDAIGAVAGEVAGALERAAPQKFSVELGFELKSESGGLVALLAKAGGTATIKVTMEWERTAPASVQV
jgi:NTP-dependent ternary system trypsin peptidase co-occuring protein